MSDDKVAQALKKLESFKKLVARLEKVASDVDDMFGNFPLLELLEEEIQEESVYAEDGYIGITGTNTSLRWTFEKVTDDWLKVYEGDCQAGREKMQKMASEFRRLAEMFEEKGKQFRDWGAMPQPFGGQTTPT
jgi:hypothetical protein